MRQVLRAEAAPMGNISDLGLREKILQPLRNVSGKGWQHGTHAQLPFPTENPLLQLFLAINPTLRQGAVHAIDVAHAVPWEVGRAGEPGANLVVRQAEPAPNFLPDGFLAGDR